MKSVLPEFPAFRDLLRIGSPSLSDIPFCNKQILMENFEAYNKHGISAEHARAAIGSTGFIETAVGKIHVGHSTGTTGRRGIYLIDDAERFAWVGAALGKLLPGFWFRRCKIAVVLPRNTALYSGVNKAGLLQLSFFNSLTEPDLLATQVGEYHPDVLIAAPRTAIALGELAKTLDPSRVIIGSETAWKPDLDALRARYRSVEQIYMATEGLIATSCKHRQMHLCEDIMKIELEALEGDLFTPVITDFSRHTQAMVRYRMNDLLKIGSPCPCGSPLLVVSEIVGRMDDALAMQTSLGDVLQINPDGLRDTILDTAPAITDFSLEQTGPVDLRLSLLATEAHLAPWIVTALSSFLARRSITPSISFCTFSQADMHHRRTGPEKLRRIRRCA